MNLQVEPVRRTARPKYPTKLEILADPKLLEQHVPPGWLSRKEVAGALSILLAAGIAGCGVGAKTAPVFLHGEGRGGVGCVVVSPPAFLSEEEARQVVAEELAGYGLQMTETDVELPKVKIPERRVEYKRRAQFRHDVFGRDRDSAAVEVWKSARSLKADLRDPEHNVVVEYISGREYFDLGGKQSGWSVDSIDMPETARFVSSRVEQDGHGGIYFGAFYDPLAKGDDIQRVRPQPAVDRDELVKQALEESDRLLREQVKDFAEWLKGQGVI